MRTFWPIMLMCFIRLLKYYSKLTKKPLRIMISYPSLKNINVEDGKGNYEMMDEFKIHENKNNKIKKNDSMKKLCLDHKQVYSMKIIEINNNNLYKCDNCNKEIKKIVI